MNQLRLNLEGVEVKPIELIFSERRFQVELMEEGLDGRELEVVELEESRDGKMMRMEKGIKEREKVMKMKVGSMEEVESFILGESRREEKDLLSKCRLRDVLQKLHFISTFQLLTFRLSFLLIYFSNPITSMLLLPSTTHLLLGTSNGTLILSDVKTCQILKTTSLIPTGNHSSSNSSSTTNINSNSKSKKSSIDQQFNTITNIQLISKPYDLHSTQSNSNLNLNIDGLNSSVETSLNSANSLGCNIISQPIRPLPLNLDRVEKINGNGNGNLLGEILPIRIEEFKEMNGFLISDQEKRLEILRNELRFSGNLDANDVEKKEMVGNANANANGSTSEKEKKDHLKEIENLRKQLNEAKSLNEEMWKKLVDQQEGEQVQDESMNLEDQDEGTRNPSNPASSSKKGKEKNKKGKKRRVGE